MFTYDPFCKRLACVCTFLLDMFLIGYTAFSIIAVMSRMRRVVLMVIMTENTADGNEWTDIDEQFVMKVFSNYLMTGALKVS